MDLRAALGASLGVVWLLSSCAGEPVGSKQDIESEVQAYRMEDLVEDYREDPQSPREAARRAAQARATRDESRIDPHTSLEQDIHIRRSFGLRASREHVARLRDRWELRAGGDVQSYGLPLTPDELHEMDERSAAHEHLFLVHEWLLDNLDVRHYAGQWGENGQIFIGVTERAREVEEALRDVFPIPERLHVVEHDRPMAVLKAIQEDVTERYMSVDRVGEAEFWALTVNASDRENVVVIGVDGDVAAADRALKDRYGGENVRVRPGSAVKGAS